MCNDYRLLVDVASIMEDFTDLQIRVEASEGIPNLGAREDIKITDVAPIVRDITGKTAMNELVTRRWSWPGPSGKPVYNFRSEGRDFASHRCLILADGFYEFTDPDDPAQKRRNKWLFTMKIIAGSQSPASGERATRSARPSARGVLFITIEDETGVANGIL